MKALGDSNRFRISMMLLERPMCVCELLEVLDIAGGTLSSHLKILKNAQIIDQRKDGKWIEYYIAGEQPKLLLSDIRKYIEDSDQLIKDKNIFSSINRSICSSGKKQ